MKLDVIFLTSLSFWEVGKLRKICPAVEMWVLFLEVAVEVESKSHSSRWGSPMKKALHAPYVRTVNSVHARGPAHLPCGWARAE